MLNKILDNRITNINIIATNAVTPGTYFYGKIGNIDSLFLATVYDIINVKDVKMFWEQSEDILVYE
jgi:hypothetical protein